MIVAGSAFAFILLSVVVFSYFRSLPHPAHALLAADSATVTVTDTLLPDTPTATDTPIVGYPPDTPIPPTATDIPPTNTPIPRILRATIDALTMSCAGDSRTQISTPHFHVTNVGSDQRTYNFTVDHGFDRTFVNGDTQVPPGQTVTGWGFGSPQSPGTIITIDIYENAEMNLGIIAEFRVTCS